jgi:hypothetical protein
MSEFIKSKAVMFVLVSLAALAALAGVFQLGMSFGERKAQHFNRWYKNYDRNFGPRMGLPGIPEPGPGGRMPGMPQPFGRQMLPGGYGVFGKVLSVDGQGLAIQDKQGVEQNIFVTSSTVIRSGDSEAALEDLLPDAQVSVFGQPNDQGQIEARLIRILDNQ